MHGKEKPRVIGSITQYVWAPEDPEKVFAKMCDPDIRIVTLTVTEKGYCFNQGTGEFDPDREDIRHDLDDPLRPTTVFGYLGQGLKRRRQAGLRPWTVLSCDNIQSNGSVARKMLLAFARASDPGFAEWIEANVAFPNCMVDRITRSPLMPIAPRFSPATVTTTHGRSCASPSGNG